MGMSSAYPPRMTPTDSQDTSSLRGRLAATEIERASILARVAACPGHVWRQVGPDRCFSGGVDTDENRAAHGGITRTVACHCGARRSENVNQHHLETGSEYVDTDPLDERIFALRGAIGCAEQLDTVERVAWRSGQCGEQVLAVPGTVPIVVQIVPYTGSGRYVDVYIDGARRCYALVELMDAAVATHLDDGQRTAWALIARRARRALLEVRS